MKLIALAILMGFINFVRKAYFDRQEQEDGTNK